MERRRRAPFRFAALLLVAQALCLAAVCGGAPPALAETPAVRPGPENRGYTQKHLADLDQGAARALARCDIVDARSHIAQMREAADVLLKNADTPIGTPAFKADAGLLRLRASEYEGEVNRCGRRHLAASPDAGQSYGFQSSAVAETMRSLLKDAADAAANCKEDLYEQAIKTIETFAENLAEGARARNSGRGRTGTGAYVDPQAERQRQDAQLARTVARDLKRTQEARFAHCAKTGEPKKTSMAPAPNPAGPRRPWSEVSPSQQAAMLAMFASNAFYVEPAVAIGRSTFGEGSVSYASTGAQPPFQANGRGESSTAFCGELSFWYALALTLNPNVNALLVASQPQLGLLTSICTYTPQRTTLFDLERHGTGRVVSELRQLYTLTLLVQVRLLLWLNPDWFDSFRVREARHDGQRYASRGDILAQAAAPGPRPWPVMLTAGIGPSFVRSKLSLTSDQSQFGGGVPAASDSRTDTGFTFRVGASSALCLRCAFGQPLMLGVDGTFTWLPSRGISLTSPAFGFTESARIGERLNTSIMFKLSVPIGLFRR